MVPDLARGILFKWTCSASFWHVPTIPISRPSLLSGITKSSRLILCFSLPSPRVTHLSKESCPFWWRIAFRNQDLDISCARSCWGDIGAELGNWIFKAWVHSEISHPNPTLQGFSSLLWVELCAHKRCWSPNHPQYLWMWHYLEKGSWQMIKLRWSN